ncbi:conserved phage C-terminal domain-containing protein [Enterococcus gallinarum]|uniref:conserved phage C-terminal domain-containing protein n=1 Tax=Enterococcus gallinarum TaxID=1353 RepID=UPI0028904CC3|nr:conserved phage C-terminal domain-containing protein [Enterococcus gallinarum]MDT2720597.1 conserved phage C-terminal domain-containing protein [Enterococcus gallinarum]
MSDKQKKRYYWLKLKENFFEEDTIEWLEEQPNGKEYCLFYLKLCLKSLKTEGMLVRNVGNMMIPYDPESLAKLTNSSADTVKVAMDLFHKIGLIQIMDGGEIYLSQLNELVGSETEYAIQKRLQRVKEDNVQKLSGKCRLEIELEKELEKELDIDKEKIPYSDIIKYLNEATNKSFKVTQKWKDLIKARWNEGQRLDDFKKVIDVKTNQWLNNQEMNKYLRPATLFGNKFDDYLNEYRPQVNSSISDEIAESQRRLLEAYEQ